MRLSTFKIVGYDKKWKKISYESEQLLFGIFFVWKSFLLILRNVFFSSCIFVFCFCFLSSSCCFNVPHLVMVYSLVVTGISSIIWNIFSACLHVLLSQQVFFWRYKALLTCSLTPYTLNHLYREKNDDFITLYEFKWKKRKREKKTHTQRSAYTFVLNHTIVMFFSVFILGVAVFLSESFHIIHVLFYHFYASLLKKIGRKKIVGWQWV